MASHHFTRQYSQRLGVLRADQLQSALDRFGLGQLLDARPVAEGTFGQNVFLTASSGEYVLRGKPHDDWQFPAERYFAALIHERTAVPVPWPYLYDATSDVFGWPYVMMPRMPGQLLPSFGAEDDLSEEDGIGIAEAMGRELAKLHAVTLPHCGEYHLGLGTIRPIEGKYAAWIAERVIHRVERCIEERALTEEDGRWCRELFAANATALEVPFTPVLVHHDYKRNNVAVERDGMGWRVSGVFDLMECYAGDGEEDLVRTVFDLGVKRGERVSAFAGAYANARQLRDGYRERFVIHMLRDALVIWGFEHRQGRDVSPGLTFRQWAGPYIYFDPFGD